VLSGTPTAAGSFAYTVTATGTTGAQARRPDTVEIVLPTIMFTSSTPPGASLGAVYKFTYTAGGDTGISYAITDGQLSPGLSLSPDGTLAGTPTKLGSYKYTVTATGTSGASAHQTDTVTITPIG
jgi:hypothetical protein